MEKLKCKDRWQYQQISTGKQGSILGRCKIRNSRECLEYCGIAKSVKTLYKDLSKIPVLILKNDSVLFDIPFEKLKDLKGLEGEEVSCIEVYLKSGE